jgi:hypothetical protein
MDQSPNWYMSSKHRVLKILSFLITSTSSIRCSMGLSKLLEYGMNALRIFS